MRGLYSIFCLEMCLFFAGGVYIGALRGSNEFFQVVDGIPTIFEESSQTWWNFLLGDIQKKLPEVCFLFVARAQSTTGEAWGAPSICPSLLFGKKQTHIFSFGQSTMFPRNQHRQLRNRDADGWSSTYSIYIMMYVKISWYLYDRYEWYSIRIMYMYICIHILRSNKLRNLELSSQGILWNTLAVRVCESGPHW